MDLGILERISRSAKAVIGEVEKMIQPQGPQRLSDLITADRICFLGSRNRDGALQELVRAASSSGACPDVEGFLAAVMDREKIVSTGIGLGVAIPHAKIGSQPDFFLCIGISAEGIDWKAIDGEPCRLIFLIGGPDNRPNDYLQVLSNLTTFLREEEVRKNLLKSTSPLDILSSFKGF